RPMLARPRLTVARAAEDDRLAPGGARERRRKVAPRRTRAQPLVQEHQRRPRAGDALHVVAEHQRLSLATAACKRVRAGGENQVSSQRSVSSAAWRAIASSAGRRNPSFTCATAVDGTVANARARDVAR